MLNVQEEYLVSSQEINDGFIMDFWEKIFCLLSKISVFYFIRKILANKIKRPYTFVESWVVGNLFAAIIGSLIIYNIKNKPVILILFIYGISRVFEIISYQLNVILFDSYRAQKEGKPYRVKSVARMLVLLAHNYVEIIFWYAVMALSIIKFNNFITTYGWTHYVKSSFLCISTFNGDALVSDGVFLSKLAFFETVSGIILTIVSIARCINTLPAIEEIDF